MTGLIRAEFIKLFKRRTFYVLVALLAALTAVLAGVFIVLAGALGGKSDLPIIGKPDAYLFGAQQILNQTWFPLILASMFLAGELATSAWATALTRNARRWQHLVARLMTYTGASWLAMVAAIGGFSLITLLFATGSGSLDRAGWLGIVWKALLVVFTRVALAAAASAWLGAVGPAIGAVLGFSFVDAILNFWSGWRGFSLSRHTSALLGPALGQGDIGGVLGQTPSFSRALLVVFAWCLASIIAAWAGLQYRDA